MRQLRDSGDHRTLLQCAFCGGETGTRDHCPSRVLLDEPYPDNLPVVPSCSKCNGSFSEDEEYLACLLECVAVGSTMPEAMRRPRIARVLSAKPALRARLENALVSRDGSVHFEPELERVTSVVTKLAKGHALYELHEACYEHPEVLEVTPLTAMDAFSRIAFENAPEPSVWPEVGSRAMQRQVARMDLTEAGWVVVQPGGYRYMALHDPVVEVRIVLREYLACRLRWPE